MTIKDSPVAYGSVTKFLHWLMFSLVIFMLATGFAFDWGLFINKAIKGFTVNLHKLIGLFILGLVLISLLWRLFNRKPKLDSSWLTRFAVKIMHFLLWMTLIAMSLTGWVMATAAGKLPDFFGILIPMPGIPSDQPLSDLAFEAHSYLAWVIVVMVAIHILAALKHHYVDKNVVLRRILPKKKKTNRHE